MRRKLMIMAASLLLCCGIKGQVSQMLIERLSSLQQRGYMIGHQDDPFYGLTWEWEKGRSDVKETCGDYPAVMGFDLGGSRWEMRKTWTPCRSPLSVRS